MIRLQDRLVEPEFAVNQQFLMQIATQEGREAPRQATQRPGQSDKPKADTEMGNSPDPYGKYLDVLVLALSGKRGGALAESFQTVVENQFLRGAPMTSSAQQCLRRAAADIFPQLSFETQWMTLFGNHYWLFATPTLNAYLRRLYESLDQHPPEANEAERSAASGPEWNERNVRFYRTGVLKRIYEADPDMGREMILAEIAAQGPRVDIEALRLLPDDLLPSLDATFAEQLASAYREADYDEYNAKLAVIERYGSAAVLPAMKSAYLHDPEGRNHFHAFLFFSYFLRTDPSFGRQLIAASLAQPRDDCSVVHFTEMAAIRLQPALRELAMKYLDDPNRCVAGNAAYFFTWGNHGAENLLWQHLEDWHKQWVATDKLIPYPEQYYEDGLVEALLFGAGPCPPQEVVERLRPLYIKGHSVDGNIAFPPLPSPVKIGVASYVGEQQLLFHLDSCSGRISLEQLESAIPRFPAQTVFEWYGPNHARRRTSLEAVQLENESLVKQQGMSFRVHSQTEGITQSANPQPPPQ